MAQDSLKIINNKIKDTFMKNAVLEKHNLAHYTKLHQLFLKHKNTLSRVQIYDITYRPKDTDQKIFAINDHINRIGENPFIGKQGFFNIDFINVEKIYLQTKTGVTTTSCGDRYDTEKKLHLFPSTYIANISALAHIHEYTVEGFLVNQL